ncbi:MAG: hypothetical protein FWE38_02135 [Firmicutes bacterium]|nr:hypothetical protein [Bacillota bacterium]
MPIVSGTLYYDGNRTASVSTATGVIPNVPIVLMDISGNILNTVVTDTNGAFQFTNVAAGNYAIAQAYNNIPGTCPPPSYVRLYSPGTVPGNALDCTVRNTWLETVAAAPITNINMMNGPVQHTPMVMDTNIIVDPQNLVTDADNGTFGTFSVGTVANTGVTLTPGQTDPYHEIMSQFTYVMAATGTANPVPNDGQYTVQNIMNNSHSNAANTWWRVADHTTGNETGRMMVINGYTAGTVIGQTTVPVTPNTNYLTSYWILNLCKLGSGYINPEFSVQITDQNNVPIYTHDFTNEIGINTQCPEWQQIGTIFKTATDTTAVTIKFISQGGPQTGNDYVLDDVALNRIDILELNITKDVSCQYATAGGTLYYEITISNPTDYVATQITLVDDIDLYDVKFTLDGETWLPWTGTLDIDDMPPNGSGNIIIRGRVRSNAVGTITNAATVTATFCKEDT